MQFYFVRHGQSANNALYDRTGASKGRTHDPELTEVGRHQAECVAKSLAQTNPTVVVKGRDPQNLAGFGITHLYCSLMVRAVGTGSAISEALGLPLHAWEDLHEEGGIYLDDEGTGQKLGRPGHNRAYFEANYPRLVLPQHVGDAGWWNRPYEEDDDRPVRARRFLAELLARHGGTDHRVALVSHGGFYNHILAQVLKLPNPPTEAERLHVERAHRQPSERHWFVLNNAAITRLDFNESVVDVVYMNRVDHLPRELIT